MAPIAPMWWFKEVPVQFETFVDTQHSVKHTVPRPRNIPQYPLGDSARHFQNQGGVFAFPDQYAKSVVWRTKDNATVLELISLSGKENTPARPISFQLHAPILPGVHIAPLTQHGGIAISLLTADSVLYRLHISAMSHFAIKDEPADYSSVLQIKWPTDNTPLLFKYLGDRHAAVASTDGALFLVRTALLAEDANRHEHAEVKVYDLHGDSHLNRIQHVSTIQKLYSKFQSALDNNMSVPAGFPEMKTSMEILAMETYTTHDDTLLFALYQDRAIRVWSVGRRQCLQVMRSPPSPNQAGYMQETVDGSSQAHLSILYNPLMPWVLRLLVYIPTESDVQLSIYTARLDTAEDVEFSPGSVSTIRPESVTGPGSSASNLIRMEINLNESQTGYTIWGLWEKDMSISAKYMQIDDPAVEREHFDEFTKRDLLDGRWWPAAMHTPPSGFIKAMSAVDDSVEDVSKYYADYVFTSGRFSDRTIMLALKSLFKDQTFALDSDLEAHVIDSMSVKALNEPSNAERERDRKGEIMNWTRFISTCAKLDYEASVPLGLSVAPDTGYMIIVKQNSMSFFTACDDSEILFHTFQDKQFEVAQFIATPPSQLRSTYPRLQDLVLRHDISRTFSAIEFLSHKLTDEAAKNLESIISELTATNGPRNFIDTFYQEHLPRYISKADMNRARNLMSSCRAPTNVFRYLILQLLYSADSSPSGLTSHRCILPYEALVAASIQQLAINRYTIAQNFLLLITVICSASPSARGWIQEETQFISDAIRLTQSLLVLKWISSRSVSPGATAAPGLEMQLSQMRVNDALLGSKISSHRQSLTGTLLKAMATEAGKYGAIEFPIYLAIPRAVSKFLHQLGILNQRPEDESRYHAGLAQRLSGLGEMKLLSQFLDIVPMTSSLAYYRGKVLLNQGKPAQALEQFMAVTASFGNDIKNVEQELDIMQLDYAKGMVRGHAKLDDYFHHVIALLQDKGAHKQVISVAKLALCDLLNNTKVQVTEAQIRTLLAYIFVAAMNTGAYEQAFNAMMLISNEAARKHFLKVFVTEICANGDGAKLSLFSFQGLEDEVEKLLMSIAEQADVLSASDSYRVLYSYYVYKGDFRNAATVMCQYARRLCDDSNDTESVVELLVEASKAYLAAINALHLAAPQYNWVAIPTKGSETDERSKRRRLSSSTSVSSKLEIVQLTDMKKEYALTAAKLQLVREIPSHIKPAALTMCARDAEIMLVRLGYFDKATSLALLWELDLDVVFNALVDRYLDALRFEQDELLGEDGLKGAKSTLVDRTRSALALQTLQKYLELHDNASLNYKYRLGVTERILMRNRDFYVQPWLKQHYLTHNPEDLIRLYLKFGDLETAAKFASVVIHQAIKKDELVSRHPNSRWLPYSLLDEIFEGLKEQIEETQRRAASRDVKAEKHAKELKALKSQLEEELQLYLENVENESKFELAKPKGRVIG
ncbi:nucleoporin Nup120/160-domain-containing protein [Dissophora ornata]|nr:hypothetical protein BGZ58_007189 [Dissophora ornata]KAI8606154.1 nucleoporin Nup120/160-domain-containing protein [Dissophora ornata]